MSKGIKEIVERAKRVVVKAGSAVIAGDGGALEENVFTRLAGEINVLLDAGKLVVLVSSGSIAVGMKKAGLSERPKTIPERQAVAALGQASLVSGYEEAFAATDRKVAQILLTQGDLSDRRRFLNARNTLSTLLGLGVLPVINENDTVAVDEIKFGDNDTLSALTTNLVEAELQIILTDIDGIFDKDPKRYDDAKRITLVEDVDSLDLDWKSVDSNLYGTGGVASKVASAKTAAHFGAATIIANGHKEGIIRSIVDGEDVGTLVMPKEDRLTSKKHWIAYSTRPSGRVFVDEGGKSALLSSGKSLLPSGVTSVDGNFEAGEVIHCVDKRGMEFARGMVNYSSSEIEMIKGLKSADIETVLGYRVYDEVIHRDNLVVL